MNPQVKRVLKKHGATIAESPKGTMLIHVEPYTSSVADKIYNELRIEGRVSMMVSIQVEPAP